ncbi:MAG: Arc family DNA-binding protein [Planctomycetota bacterium]
MTAKGDKKGFLLRVPQPLFDELRRWSEQEMRSINGQIEWILRDALRRRSHGLPAPEITDPSTPRARRKTDEPPSQ